MKSNKLRDAIATLIATTAVGTQSEIRAALMATGIRATQPTICRHLTALGAVRVRDGGGFRYAIQGSGDTMERLAVIELRLDALEAATRG